MKNFIIDMDGVLVRGNQMIPGADGFINKLREQNRNFLLLTNNPTYTPGDLAHRLQSIGINITENQIFTSALATAAFLHRQRPDGKAFVLGESGLTEAIHDIGYVITDMQPDYVVVGETKSYDYQMIKKAIRLIHDGGARFIATNPDSSGPSEGGIVPACGAMAALIQKASGVEPFFVGKPNALMMRTALNFLNVHSENTLMVGDRMDTDIVSGVTSGMETILVLSGVTKVEDINRYPYLPTYVRESVANIEPEEFDD
ncbi:MAG TPA: TIGR01457 family HAD-type hydrolase [Anaerolineaceae bacterium]|jgi:NagD protein|nr:TIGR01457 family HAD-type hydrolase [Anaerolineaceae bacterium]